MADEIMDPSLQNIIDSKTLRWVFVGGKGGVGKTTTSCSLAAQLAKHRESVLLISTDPAHNLSDAFGQKFSSKPTLVPGFDNLFAMEINPSTEISEELENAESKSFFSEIATSIPGIDEAMSFAELMKQVQSMSYSTIVFDTAPTGHTLRLLSFPTVIEKAFEKINSLKGRFSGLFGQVAGMLGMGNQDESFMGKLEEIQTSVRQINAHFQNPEVTTFVCVCIPEFLSLFETERLVQELTGFGIETSNIVVNQVLYPDDGAECRKCAARQRMQGKYLDQIDALYSDFHVVKMPMLDEEVRGQDSLLKFGGMLASGIPDKYALTDATELAKIKRC